MTFVAACVQLSSQNDMQANLQVAEGLIKRASDEGADFVAVPENVAFISTKFEEVMANSYVMGEHPALLSLCEVAAKFGVWLLVGSLAVKEEGSGKLRNRSFLIDDSGEVRSFYDKMHLFDVSVKGGESHRESDKFVAGEKAVLADMPWCRLGMTICYDLRFPELYRQLALGGAEMIAVPSAFTKFTGEAHWHVLLRARAIETGSYVIAPAQVGSHPVGRETYGHALIIDPWGEVIADAGEGEGVVLAEIDPKRSDDMRQQLPNLQHGKKIVF